LLKFQKEALKSVWSFFGTYPGILAVPEDLRVHVDLEVLVLLKIKRMSEI
jgi:hypothetical protein